MTKAQIVSHIPATFEFTSKKKALAILDELTSLAVSETNKTDSFTLPGIGKLVLVKKLVWVAIQLLVSQSKFLLRQW